jgi:ferric-dicitrate binding protein FerR (iron transport regulator)
LRDHISSLRKATENDVERAAARWLAQLGQRNLSSEKLAEFDAWLEDPEHEVAIARLIIAQLDAEVSGKPFRK